MEGSNNQLYKTLGREMANSCYELSRRIDNYVAIKLISKKPNSVDKYAGETFIRDYIARAQYDSFSLFGSNVLTEMRKHFMSAVDSASERLNLAPEVLLSIIGRLNFLSEEAIDVCTLQLPAHEPPKEFAGKSSPIQAPQPEDFPPEDINADIKDLLEQIESLVFYDCLKEYFHPEK